MSRAAPRIEPTPPRPGLPSAGAEAWVMLAAPLLVALFAPLFYVARLRPLGQWTLGENHLIELMTFATLFAGGWCGLRWAWMARRVERGVLAPGFCAIFSLGLLLAAMEEIAWGQWFFRFPTPAWLAAINSQHEFTLHNIRGMNGHTGYLRLAFGLGGILGAILSRWPRWQRVAPPRILLPWFVVIAALAALDLWVANWPITPRIDRMVWNLSEVAEMMVGISGLLYVWLGASRIQALRAAGALGANLTEAPPRPPTAEGGRHAA